MKTHNHCVCVFEQNYTCFSVLHALKIPTRKTRLSSQGGEYGKNRVHGRVFLGMATILSILNPILRQFLHPLFFVPFAQKFAQLLYKQSRSSLAARNLLLGRRRKAHSSRKARRSGFHDLNWKHVQLETYRRCHYGKSKCGKNGRRRSVTTALGYGMHMLATVGQRNIHPKACGMKESIPHVFLNRRIDSHDMKALPLAPAGSFRSH